MLFSHQSVVRFIIKRLKSTKLMRWQKTNKENAQKYFNDNYSCFYGKRWRTIEEALLSPHNHVALLNNFNVAVAETKQLFYSIGARNIRDICNEIKNGNENIVSDLIIETNSYEPNFTQENGKESKIDGHFSINLENEIELNFPEDFDVFIPLNSMAKLPRTTSNTNNIQSHFLMDGASILPPFLLDVQPGDRVYDACSAPGGKSLFLLQTKHLLFLVCNDIKQERVKRIFELFRAYIPNFDDDWIGKQCEIQRKDARGCRELNCYDKILVDVPCSADRHAITDGDNFIFRPANRDKLERMPIMQTEILTNCIRLLKPGGSLVYSTCTLDPNQNDKVVEAAIHRASHKHSILCSVRNLQTAMRPFRRIFKFYNGNKLKYGQLIIPDLLANYGPMYFSKIIRNN